MTTTIPTRIPDEPIDHDIARTLQRLASGILDVGTTPIMVDIIVQYQPGSTADVDALAKEIDAPAPVLDDILSSNRHYVTRLRAQNLRVAVLTAADEAPEHKRDRLRRELAELDAQIRGVPDAST